MSSSDLSGSNTNDGDGCSSSWSAETGFTWSGGSSTSSDVWSDTCGDGKHYSSLATFWDDGNTIGGDGWNSSWSVETGWICSGGSSTSKDNWNEIWGDGKRFNSLSTYWDDGNSINGDGCSSTWSICGDGKRYVSGNSKCDDGNTLSGDGCSSSCFVETGFTWSGGGSLSPDICSEICGDGKRYSTGSSKCDDGNIANGDGCSSTCTIETGFTWSGGGSLSPDICSEICGDGKRYSTGSSKCDDGNIANGDGCSSTCTIETGWLFYINMGN